MQADGCAADRIWKLKKGVVKSALAIFSAANIHLCVRSMRFAAQTLSTANRSVLRPCAKIGKP